MTNTHNLSKQSSQDHQHPGGKTLKSISYNANEIIGDMKRTKIQQTKTGEPTKSPETKSKKQSKKRKLSSTEKFYLQKLENKFGR